MGILDYSAQNPWLSDALATISQGLLSYGSGNPNALAQLPQYLAERQGARRNESRQAKLDERQNQLFQMQMEEQQRNANKRKAQEDAWMALSRGQSQPMTGGTNPAQRGLMSDAAPTMPRSGGLLDQFDPSVASYLDAYGKADPAGAMSIIGEQLFKENKPVEWDIKTIREGGNDVTYRINPITGDREKLGEGAAWAPPQPKEPKAPRDTYRTLSDAEEKQMGLDTAGTYQMGTNGKVDVVNAPKSNQVLTQVGTNPDGSPIMDFVTAGGKPPTESELKGAGLLEKALPELDTAITNFDALTNAKDMAVGSIPVLGNALQSEGYQRGRNSIKTISAAYLYSVSGAQAPESEVQRTMEEVMPKFGDEPATLADKKARLQNMIDSIKIKAGRAAPLGQQDQGKKRLKYNIQTGDFE